MRSLLLPAALALILHGFLFTWKAEWMNKKPVYMGAPRPVTLIMAYKKAQAQKPSQPELTLKPEPEKEPIKKEPPPKPKKNPRLKPETRPKTLSMKKEKVIPPPPPQPPPSSEPAPAQLPAPKSLAQEESGKIPAAQKESASASLSKKRTDSIALTKGKEKAPKPANLPVTEAIPNYKTNPPPGYPRLARRRGYEGTVLMEVLVNREGRVEALRLLESSGHDVLDREAMAAVKTWLFEPGRMGKEKVDMWVKVPVRFKLK